MIRSISSPSNSPSESDELRSSEEEEEEEEEEEGDDDDESDELEERIDLRA